MNAHDEFLNEHRELMRRMSEYSAEVKEVIKQLANIGRTRGDRDNRTEGSEGK